MGPPRSRSTSASTSGCRRRTSRSSAGSRRSSSRRTAAHGKRTSPIRARRRIPPSGRPKWSIRCRERELGASLAATSRVAKQRDTITRVIGGFKLAKAALLIAVGVGALSIARGHDAHVLAKALRIKTRFVNHALGKVAGTSPHRLAAIGAGSFIYAALFVVEGIGLLLRRVWAEYVTIVITTSFVPLEIYELVERASLAKAIALVVNVAIVAYLALRLRSTKHWPFA